MRRFIYLLLALLSAAHLFAQADIADTAEGTAAKKKASGGGGGGGGCTPSYSNTGGQGNRTGIITVTDVSGGTTLVFHQATGETLVDGKTDTSASNWFTGSASPGNWFQFDFGASALITEIEYIQSDGSGQGVWQISGSNDGSSFSNIGSTFTLGGTADQIITAISGNTSSFRYYRFTLVSGTTSNGPYIIQMKFKICGLGP